MGGFENAVKEYNKYVNEWNDRYGTEARALSVDIDEFDESYIGRLKTTMASNEMTQRRRVNYPDLLAHFTPFCSLLEEGVLPSNLDKCYNYSSW